MSKDNLQKTLEYVGNVLMAFQIQKEITTRGIDNTEGTKTIKPKCKYPHNPSREYGQKNVST